MILGGLALAFSRLIDNSVVVLENIFRHLEMGESPEVAAEKGGAEVALPVLAATFATVVVFFPVTFLYGVSQFLFTALALSVVFSLFASYIVAMTVVPLFCAKLIKGHGGQGIPARRLRCRRDKTGSPSYDDVPGQPPTRRATATRAGSRPTGLGRSGSTPGSTPGSTVSSIGSTASRPSPLARPLLTVLAILGALRC